MEAEGSGYDMIYEKLIVDAKELLIFPLKQDTFVMNVIAMSGH